MHTRTLPDPLTSLQVPPFPHTQDPIDKRLFDEFECRTEAATHSSVLQLVEVNMSGRKETVLDLAKFVDKGVQVKLTGGRQGILCSEASDLFIFCIAFIVEPMDEFIDFFVICHWLFYCVWWVGAWVGEVVKYLNPLKVNLSPLFSVTGTLKGYDQLLNLVLDEAVEFLRDPEDPLKTTDQTRRLGLIVCRGTAVMLVSPTDGTDEIANPFVQSDGA
ncbi:hypothetical protein OROGR_020950 [Orobanche gracilis]